MSKKVTSVSKLVDEAVDELPFLRRRLTKAYFRFRPEAKELCCLQAMAAVAASECCDYTVWPLQSFGDEPSGNGMTLAAAFEAGTVDVDTPFAIDLDKLERLLQMIIQYLPKILEIILPLFM